jgi:uncharacterized transporter YbjL
VNAWHDARARLCGVLAGAVTIALAIAWRNDVAPLALEALAAVGAILWLNARD